MNLESPVYTALALKKTEDVPLPHLIDEDWGPKRPWDLLRGVPCLVAAAHSRLSTPTSDALCDMVCISFRVNKTSIKFLSGHFGDKEQPSK